MHAFDPAAERTARACLDYALERLRLDPVPLDGPVSADELTARAGRTITAEGRDPEAVLRVFTDVLAPACISTDSPRFFAFIPGAPTKASLVFDTVVAASSINTSSWLEASGAVYAENEALAYLAELAGFPEGAGGCFVSGGSAGNLSALVVAREHVARAGGRPRGPSGRWEVAVSEQSHSSIASTLRILDCEPFVVRTDEHDRLTGEGLRAALGAAPEAASVFAIAATAGTTNAGIVDDLAGLADEAAARGLWLHVDGAYGAAALCAPSVRDVFTGIERADSFVVDPHKWLFAPFDSCALVYREPALAREIHAQHASYLDAIRTEGEWNPADYAYHLSRRARGLPFWYSLAVHGTDAYRDAVERVLATASAAADRVRAAPHVDLVREPGLSVLLWRRHGWSEMHYVAWSRRLLREQIAFCLPTRWKDETVARAVFLHPDTTVEMFDEVLDSMR